MEQSVDHFDQKLLSLLRDNARLSISDLARSVFLSRSAVSERLRRLEEDGIITGSHAHIQPHAAAEGVKAFFELSFRMIGCEEYAVLLRQIPEVRQCYSISGDTDLLVAIEAGHLARVEEIRKQIETFPHLTMIKTHIVLRALLSDTP